MPRWPGREQGRGWDIKVVVRMRRDVWQRTRVTAARRGLPVYRYLEEVLLEVGLVEEAARARGGRKPTAREVVREALRVLYGLPGCQDVGQVEDASDQIQDDHDGGEDLDDGGPERGHGDVGREEIHQKADEADGEDEDDEVHVRSSGA